MNCIFLRRGYPTSGNSGGSEPPIPSGPFAVVITGDYVHPYMYIDVNEKSYYQATTLEISGGTAVNVVVSSDLISWGNSVTVKLNGTTVQTGAGTYSFTPTSNITIASDSNSSGFTVSITTS